MAFLTWLSRCHFPSSTFAPVQRQTLILWTIASIRWREWTVDTEPEARTNGSGYAATEFSFSTHAPRARVRHRSSLDLWLRTWSAPTVTMKVIYILLSSRCRCSSRVFSVDSDYLKVLFSLGFRGFGSSSL